jgi:hypothetical protein
MPAAERPPALHTALVQEYNGDFAVLERVHDRWQRLAGYDDAYLRRQLPETEGLLASVLVGDQVFRQGRSADGRYAVSRATPRATLSDDIPDYLLTTAAGVLHAA